MGKNAPGPKRQYYVPKEYQDKEDEESDFIPVDDTGTPTDDYKPWEPRKRGSSSQEEQYEKNMKMLNFMIWTLVIFLAVCLGCRYRKEQQKKRAQEKDQVYDDEKDPPLACRDQENKRLPKTDEKESYKPPTINESVCDLTQNLDNSSDEEEQVGVMDQEEEEQVEEKEE